MHREDKGHCLADIVVNAAAQPNGVDDGTEIIIQQDNRRCFARNIRSALAHRDADMRRLERRRVIDPVSGHRNDFACGLVGIHDPQFLFGHDPREHGHIIEKLGESGVVHRLQLRACQHFAIGNARLKRDGAGSGSIIAGDHHHPYASTAALCDCGRHALANGVGKANQANQFELIVALRFGPSLVRGMCSCNAKHADALCSHRIDRRGHALHCRRGQAAEASNRLGCTLGCDDITALRIYPCPDVRHREQFGP